MDKYEVDSRELNKFADLYGNVHRFQYGQLVRFKPGLGGDSLMVVLSLTSKCDDIFEDAEGEITVGARDFGGDVQILTVDFCRIEPCDIPESVEVTPSEPRKFTASIEMDSRMARMNIPGRIRTSSGAIIGKVMLASSAGSLWDALLFVTENMRITGHGQTPEDAVRNAITYMSNEAKKINEHISEMESKLFG